HASNSAAASVKSRISWNAIERGLAASRVMLSEPEHLWNFRKNQKENDQRFFAALRMTPQNYLTPLADSVRFKHITDTTDCVNQFGLEWIVYLCAQPADDHIDDVCVSGESDVPDLLCDLVARHHGTGRANEVRKQEKFFRRNVERNS